ncbi:MAG: hypothetical protein OEZ13_08310 [Spirochaetia bacterium]|nr:hypothetical protein [Spirochaetia bacterium]
MRKILSETKIDKRTLFIIFISIFSFCGAPVENKKREFSFCKELAANECMPPLLEKEVNYIIENPNMIGTMKKFIDSLEKKETLSFHLKFINEIEEEELIYWKKQFKAYYSFEEDSSRHEIKDIRINENGALGELSLPLIFKKKFHDALSAPYKEIPSFTIYYKLYLGKKMLGTRSITLRFKINTITIR